MNAGKPYLSEVWFTDLHKVKSSTNFAGDYPGKREVIDI